MQDFDDKSANARLIQQRLQSLVATRNSQQAARNAAQVAARNARKKGQTGEASDSSAEEIRSPLEDTELHGREPGEIEASKRNAQEQDGGQGQELAQDPDLEFKEQLFTVSTSDLQFQDREKWSKESISAAQSFVFSTTVYSQEQKVTAEKLVHLDTFTAQVRIGRDEALCTVSPARGEGEYVHTTYTGELDANPHVNNPSNLCSIELAIMGPVRAESDPAISSQVDCIANIAEQYTQTQVDASGMTSTLAEFPPTFGRKHNTNCSVEVANLVSLVRQEAVPHIQTKVFSHELLEEAKQIDYFRGYLGRAA